MYSVKSFDRCKQPDNPHSNQDIIISLICNVLSCSFLFFPVGLASLVAQVQVKARHCLSCYILPFILNSCQLDIHGWERYMRTWAKQEGREKSEAGGVGSEGQGGPERACRRLLWCLSLLGRKHAEKCVGFITAWDSCARTHRLIRGTQKGPVPLCQAHCWAWGTRGDYVRLSVS